MENRSIDYRRPSSTRIAVEHYRDGQCSDSNPSFTLYLDWTLYIFLYFIISSPLLIPGTVEVPYKTGKSAEQILFKFHWLWLQKWIFQRLLKIMVTWVPSLSIVNWKLQNCLMRTWWSADSTTQRMFDFSFSSHFFFFFY